MSENVKKLKLYRSILAPFLEGYWHVGCALKHLICNEMEETRFIQMVQHSIVEKINQGLIECSK